MLEPTEIEVDFLLDKLEAHNRAAIGYRVYSIVNFFVRNPEIAKEADAMRRQAISLDSLIRSLCRSYED